MNIEMIMNRSSIFTRRLSRNGTVTMAERASNQHTCNKSIHWRNALLGVLAVFLSSTPVYAQENNLDDAINACLEAVRLVREEDDIVGALDEANWCVEGLKQMKAEITLSLLPEELDGFVGGELSQENAMGMSVIERTYTKDSRSLTVNITGGGALGGLGALAQLGAVFGSVEGGKKVRVQKRTVWVNENGRGGNLRVELKSGGLMNVESNDFDSQELLVFLRQFPLAELDDALKP